MVGGLEFLGYTLGFLDSNLEFLGLNFHFFSCCLDFLGLAPCFLDGGLDFLDCTFDSFKWWSRISCQYSWFS